MEVVLQAENGRRLTLSDIEGTVEDLKYRAHLTTETADGSVEVWECRTTLPQFLRSLAGEWRGFDGVKDFNSLEGQLSLSCRYDGVGSVLCRVTIGRLGEPEWSMSAVLSFGAGAHLERLAADTEAFFDGRA